MGEHTIALQELYNRIPRRHSADNVKEIYGILDEYETILGAVEAIDAAHEKSTAPLYPSLDNIRNTIKMSTSNKASKKGKDDLFDEASGSLKDDIQALMNIAGTAV
jgi:hypothetical protein